MYLQHESDEQHTANDMKKMYEQFNFIRSHLHYNQRFFACCADDVRFCTTMTMFCSLTVVLFLEKDSETNEKSNEKRDHGSVQRDLKRKKNGTQTTSAAKLQ